MPTERLWLTEPGRSAALAKVTEVRGDTFRLDRSLYVPRSRAYCHPQRSDRGVVWLPSGEKRNVATVFETESGLWHRLKGAVPTLGDRLRCHIDVERRDEVARAHTALHLFIESAVATAHVPSFAQDPEVQGGGTARLAFRDTYVSPERLQGWLQAANQRVLDDVPVSRDVLPRDHAKHQLLPQPFIDDPFPGPATTLEAVFCGSSRGLPCDGTHVRRTSELGMIRIRHGHNDRSGNFVVVLEVKP